MPVRSRAVWRCCRDVYISDTSAQARRDVLEGVLARDWRDYFLHNLRRTKMLVAPKIDPEMPDEQVTPQYLAENLWIVGDVDEVTAKLRRLYDEVGGFGTLLVIGHEWLPGDAWHRSMTLLAQEVLPRLPSVSAELLAATDARQPRRAAAARLRAARPTGR
jgi:alkanesulfonate monooxygenase SsuD/methylene tetrahydromethanopterin reductase-like flavin-dependent oxidoreductase (luciferase family)